MRLRFSVHLERTHVSNQNALAAQLALILREVFRTMQRSVDDAGSKRSVSRWSPRQRKADERGVIRLDERAVKFLVLPRITERPPRFEMNVLQPVRLQAFHNPLRRSAMVWRARNTRTIDLGKIEEVIHHL